MLHLNKQNTMNFETTQTNNGAVVNSKVEKLDASNASELKSELVLLNKNGINNIVIDLSKTRYCDSSGLSAVLTANRLCKDTNGQFVLCGLQDNVRKLIEIAQLDKVLTITENQEQALEVIHQ
jgi:anti-sigma B factor antagonist